MKHIISVLVFALTTLLIAACNGGGGGAGGTAAEFVSLEDFRTGVKAFHVATGEGDLQIVPEVAGDMGGAAARYNAGEEISVPEGDGTATSRVTGSAKAYGHLTVGGDTATRCDCLFTYILLDCNMARLEIECMDDYISSPALISALRFHLEDGGDVEISKLYPESTMVVWLDFGKKEMSFQGKAKAETKSGATPAEHPTRSGRVEVVSDFTAPFTVESVEEK